MKNLIFISMFAFILSSCASSGWSKEDQQQYTSDCMQMAQGVENAEDICECGLEKAMEKYDSKEEAEKEIQGLSEEELQKMFGECI